MLDVFGILAEKIKLVPDGDYLLGLHAVRSHVEVAIRHLKRGQDDQDETAFTDAIYRCNQAFEGSVKEAYRVLAQEDPEHKTSFKIEAYLSSNNILRKRVLDQFTTYRVEWRNASTHNYKLDFDEDEALLAIVSVTVFAIVLCDQITEKLTISAVKQQTAEPVVFPAPLPQVKPEFLDHVAKAVASFANDTSLTRYIGSGRTNEAGIVAALTGYLQRVVPGAQVSSEIVMADDQIRPDVVVEASGFEVIVDVKVGRADARGAAQRAIAQLNRYLSIRPEALGLALVYTPGVTGHEVHAVNDRVLLVGTSRSRLEQD